MKEKQVSLTAIMTAYLRGYHATKDTSKIFDDFLAYPLIPEERRRLIEQGFSKAVEKIVPERDSARSEQVINSLPSLLQAMGLPHVLSRSRYMEDNLDQAVKQGVKQYVILGAGLDTFAFRRPDLRSQVQVFEVDHPATQAFKLDRLAELEWDIPSNLHFVPMDFTKENLADALKGTAYHLQSKTLFSWLGVTMYLARNEVLATLRSIADMAPVDSTVIFDYFVPEAVTSYLKENQEDLQRIGEPIQTVFDPSTLAFELGNSGFRLDENLSPSDIEERYFQGRRDDYHASQHVRFARAVVE